MLLSWQEHLTENEMPPAWMWTLDDELDRHFEKVKRQRKSGFTDTDDDDDSGMTVHNEYARGRGRAR